MFKPQKAFQIYFMVKLTDFRWKRTKISARTFEAKYYGFIFYILANLKFIILST